MTDYIIDRERGDGNWLSCYNGFLVTMRSPLIIRLGSIAMQTKAGIGLGRKVDHCVMFVD